MSDDVGGKLRFQVTISADEMRTWRPERIAAFFTGVARAIRAKDGVDTKKLPKASQREAREG